MHDHPLSIFQTIPLPDDAPPAPIPPDAAGGLAVPAPPAAPAASDAASGLTAAADQGLRSVRGIRWLLLAGGLVTGVSVYRLVQSQWALLTAPLQFLILTAGALAIFGLGMAARRRLGLPFAGAALLGLFAGLIPVLSWGAAYLGLLSTPAGWIACGAGMAALLAAAVRGLRETLGYGGRLYPAALGAMMAAPPLLPWLAQAAARGGLSRDAVYVAAGLALGAVLAAGCRHVNRFFFHRDRLAGAERPVQLAPFMVLGALYLGALTRLDLHSVFLGLPLAVVGLALAGTGQEYFDALAEALGRAPERWPLRSLELLTLGVATMAAAVPVSLLDPSHRCLAAVTLLAAWRLLSWSWRYGSAGAHLAGLAAALCAYRLIPALLPRLTAALETGFLALSGLPAESPALSTYGFLPFLAGLAALAAALDRRRAPGRLRSLHATLTALAIASIATLALLDPRAALPALALTLAAAAAALAAARRIEIVPGLYGAFTALLTALGGRLFGPVAAPAGWLLPGTVCLLAACALALAAAGPAFEPWLARFVDEDAARVRRTTLLPAAMVAALAIACSVLQAMPAGDPLSGVELLLAAGVLLAAGTRLGSASGFTCGAFAAALGAHVTVRLAHGGDLASAAPWLALVTLGCYLTAWLAARLPRRRGSFDRGQILSELASFHGLLGLAWLGLALTTQRVTVEPLILPVFGLGLIHEALRGPGGRRREALTPGLALLVAWVPAQLQAFWTPDWSTAVPMTLAAAAPVLVLLLAALRGGWLRRLEERYGSADGFLRHDAIPPASSLSIAVPLPAVHPSQGVALPGEPPRRIAASLADLVASWRTLALAACLLVASPAAWLLAAALVGVVFLANVELEGRGPAAAVPLRLTLALLLQTAIQLSIATAMTGSHAPAFLPACLDALGAAPFAFGAVLALAWTVAVTALGRQGPLASWLHGVEALAALGYLTLWSVRPPLSPTGQLALATAACGWLALHLRAAVLSARSAPDLAGGVAWDLAGGAREAWMAQAWALIAVLHGFTAGWLHALGGTAAPYGLLAIGLLQYGLGACLARTRLGRVFVPSCRAIGCSLALAAGLLALFRLWAVPAAPVWLSAGAGFLASLFFLVVAMSVTPRVAPALAAASFLGASLLGVFARTALGTEFYFLAPGLTLLAVAYLLRREIGPVWSRHLAAAGAACIYATPIVALSAELSWGWLTALLLSSVAFGSASFTLRSRSLLTVSTAAMLADLVFFVLEIGTAAPLLLWAFGLAFGLGLMAAGAWLEYRREGVLQQLRVFGRELRSWS